MQWFDVDKEGLAKLLAKRGIWFVLFELIQNAWDTAAKFVTVTLVPIAGQPKCRVVVIDDDPEGFTNLTHAFTLFAESTKKGDAEKRGRFNLGEKLVLAMCDEARIESTKGSVIFDKDGRRNGRTKLARGSKFEGTIRMTRDEYEQTIRMLRTLLPLFNGPETYINGEKLPVRPGLARIGATLPTEIGDAEGVLRRAERKTEILVYDPLPGETPTLYEMGIPVVETNDKWHVDIRQKVPLNFDRDNVPPAYLRRVRALVLNELHENLTREDANQTWVRDASSNKDCSELAIERVLDLRFGDKRVSYDPSDPEANKLAVSKGYTLVTGGMLSGQEWENARNAGAILPAGQVTPSRPTESEAAVIVPEEQWTHFMRRVAKHAREIGVHLLGIGIHVTIVNNPFAGTMASFNKQTSHLMLNIGILGQEWFQSFPTGHAIDSLLIHEFAHYYSGDHLSEQYHDALCDLGAKLARLALEHPELWKA